MVLFAGLFYSYRLFYYVFFDFKKAKKNVYLTVPNEKILKSTIITNTTLASDLTIVWFSITVRIFFSGVIVINILLI